VNKAVAEVDFVGLTMCMSRDVFEQPDLVAVYMNLFTTRICLSEANRHNAINE